MSAGSKMAVTARWVASVFVPAPVEKRVDGEGVFGGRIADLLLGLGSIA
jgi:hypothetical protein